MSMESTLIRIESKIDVLVEKVEKNTVARQVLAQRVDTMERDFLKHISQDTAQFEKLESEMKAGLSALGRLEKWTKPVQQAKQKLWIALASAAAVVSTAISGWIASQ